jgi:hypothetical protein
LVCEARGSQYFIQDLRNLKGRNVEDFKHHLCGPLTKERFEDKRDSLGVDEDLGFSISY